MRTKPTEIIHWFEGMTPAEKAKTKLEGLQAWAASTKLLKQILHESRAAIRDVWRKEEKPA